MNTATTPLNTDNIRFHGPDPSTAAKQKDLLEESAEIIRFANSVYESSTSLEVQREHIATLADHLLLPYTAKAKEAIIRALMMPEARGLAGRRILMELKADDGRHCSHLRWVMAYALTVVADPTMTADITEMLEDESFQEFHGILKKIPCRLLGRHNPNPCLTS